MRMLSALALLMMASPALAHEPKAMTCEVNGSKAVVLMHDHPDSLAIMTPDGDFQVLRTLAGGPFERGYAIASIVPADDWLFDQPVAVVGFVGADYGTFQIEAKEQVSVTCDLIGPKDWDHRNWQHPDFSGDDE